MIENYLDDSDYLFQIQMRLKGILGDLKAYREKIMLMVNAECGHSVPAVAPDDILKTCPDCRDKLDIVEKQLAESFKSLDELIQWSKRTNEDSNRILTAILGENWRKEL